VSGVQAIEVTAAEADLRFDRWCKRHFPTLTQARLQKLLRKGQFRLDGKRVQASDRVQPGQIVRVPPLDEAPAPRRRPVDEADARFIRSLVIHEDDWLYVLNKPTGLAVQGGSRTTRHIDGMLDALRTGEERPRLVHRLDRDTSGVLIIAKGGQAAKRLMHAFQQHEVRKLYWAVALGRPPRSEGVIDLKLGKDKTAGREIVTPEAPDAKKAMTGFRVIARAGKVGAWLGLLPITGRTHQLRAHCAAVGTPILGDAKYGAVPPSTAPAGLMLHAREIELPHPRRGTLRVAAEPPAHFKEGLAWLGLPEERLHFSSLEDWPDEL